MARCPMISSVKRTNNNKRGKISGSDAWGRVRNVMKITQVSAVVYRQQLKPGGSTPKFAGERRS